MKPVSKTLKGTTLVEMLLAVLLMSVVFLAVTALYVASQKFYFTASDRVTILYELQYAVEHIYKNAITGIGDKNNPAITVSSGNLELSIRHIEQSDPFLSPTYNNYSDDTLLSYKIDEDNGTLLYDGDGDGVYEESLVPGITIVSSDSSFALDGNTLIVTLKGQYKDQEAALYSSSFARLSSYQ